MILVLLAGLVTLTTRTSDMADVVVAVVRPLRRFGVDYERLGLLLALGIRSVPIVIDLAVEVRDAQHARGLAGDARAFAVPLVVRSLRRADAMSEALVARGVND
jgi:biotin transport system permease protein